MKAREMNYGTSPRRDYESREMSRSPSKSFKKNQRKLEMAQAMLKKWNKNGLTHLQDYPEMLARDACYESKERIPERWWNSFKNRARARYVFIY